MSFRNPLNLPVGITPGSVPDAPATPPVREEPRIPGGIWPMNGKELARHAMDLLCGIRDSLQRLVELQETDTSRYLMQGSVAGGSTIGTTAATIMRPNANRRGLSVQNNGTAGNLTIGLGQGSPIEGTGIVLAPGSSWDGRVSGQMWRGLVSVIGSQSGVVYSWLEV